ncbi:Prefoldin subunit-like protein [Hapsidospora chrysogenum ATCC 11550]|uniref:Prefoldin subunit-like protein n=1 Tax=Hapsidospora chrysogenum (strain ATCC 11550 / CBS 779.69 / DSM 880 / IAM 14645 / JCM 23072 / IMI 49137) TaxID=857340 RepID=A0A086T9F1_HAPC1|nr:Prefoldin subunit-like protein [Hapsidospora chrysogenum ATCC 11550]
MAAADPQVRLQALSEDFQKLQHDLQEVVASRQKLEGQKQENVGVKKVVSPELDPLLLRRCSDNLSQEFDNLGEDETIYKLVGPVLLKQEKFEAESTVKGRLDYINGEISRLEGQIKETQEKLEKKKTEIIQIQASAQAAAGAGGHSSQ